MPSHAHLALPVLNEQARSRFERLSAELVQAWDACDAASTRQWAVQSCQTFGVSLGRRSNNLLRLVKSVGRGVVRETALAAQALARGHLIAHGQHRGQRALAAGADHAKQMSALVETLTRQIRTQPRETLPAMLTVTCVSLLVSGGPDGDGGAPDLDLMFGIDAHRSVLTHSILMGAALETAVLSLMRLVQLVHAKLPPDHDALWDRMASESETILNAGNVGASLGMSYHLLVDGLAQPAAVHGLGVSLPMEAHQAFLTANALAEGLDAAGKPRPRTSFPGDAPPALAAPRAEVTPARFELDESVVQVLDELERLILERHGQRMHDLARGARAPATPAEHSFVAMSQGKQSASTRLERTWRLYQGLARA